MSNHSFTAFALLPVLLAIALAMAPESAVVVEKEALPSTQGPAGVVDQACMKGCNATKAQPTASAWHSVADIPRAIEPKITDLAWLIRIDMDYPGFQPLRALNDETEELQLQKNALAALQLITFEKNKLGLLLPQWDSLFHLGTTQLLDKTTGTKGFDLVQLVNYLVLSVQETNRRIDDMEKQLRQLTAVQNAGRPI